LKDLSERVEIQVKGLDDHIKGNLKAGEKRVLSPLLGYVQ
jgi:hypothetical protein